MSTTSAPERRRLRSDSGKDATIALLGSPGMSPLVERHFGAFSTPDMLARQHTLRLHKIYNSKLAEIIDGAAREEGSGSGSPHQPDELEMSVLCSSSWRGL